MKKDEYAKRRIEELYLNHTHDDDEGRKELAQEIVKVYKKWDMDFIMFALEIMDGES